MIRRVEANFFFPFPIKPGGVHWVFPVPIFHKGIPFFLVKVSGVVQRQRVFELLAVLRVVAGISSKAFHPRLRPRIQNTGMHGAHIEVIPSHR